MSGNVDAFDARGSLIRRLLSTLDANEARRMILDESDTGTT
jgi:hypothetical protein